MGEAEVRPPKANAVAKQHPRRPGEEQDLSAAEVIGNPPGNQGTATEGQPGSGTEGAG